MSDLIEAHNLCKTFTTSVGDVHAVKGLSLTVRSGEVFGLLGANGAGKTTTLRMILGLMKPTSGSASVAGFDVASQPEHVKRSVALVSASAGLYQWLSSRELMHYFADLYDVPLAQAHRRVDQLAGAAQLNGHLATGLAADQLDGVLGAHALGALAVDLRDHILRHHTGTGGG